MYVALNNHYHNFNLLYKSGFGDSVDNSIIESTIAYWFMDDDYPANIKLSKLDAR